ncbi:MAG TPA: VCBS repeat-containing protein [Verrucomicrobia bacterium]|nr:VCBS repeat-containing protein [Verrucomicrobiota bacterium]
MFDDDSFLVLRSEIGDSNAVIANEGVQGFLRTLQSIMPPVSNIEILSVHFHIVSVSVGIPTSRTRIVFEAEMRNGHQIIQQNAVWNCQWRAPNRRGGLPLLDQIRLESFEEIYSKKTAVPLFADCTEAVLKRNACYRDQLVHGIEDWSGRLDWRFGLELIGSAGIAVGDVDGDGMDDLFYCETGGLPNRLFLHQEDGTLLDYSKESGLNYLEPTHSALILDIDNDGDQDLVFASGRYLLFFSNDGRARFKRMTLIQTDSIFRSLSAVDYDLDGDLDLYACGYFSRTQDKVGLGRPLPYHDANNGTANLLLENRGDWNFHNATEEAGLNQNNNRFSYAASWEDYDLDGDPDLYVANDFGRNNLYRNDHGVFTDVAAEAGVEDIAAGMSVSWGDYNHDGLMDLYVGNMFSSAGNRIAYQRKYHKQQASDIRSSFQRHARGNTLFENAGDGTFRDVSLETGTTRARWAWGSLFADLNNDGWEDLIVANGFVTGRHDSGDL